MLTADDLRAMLSYDAESGAFTWRFSRGNRRGGDEAGSISSDTGYIVIRVERTLYTAQRLAWLHVHGEWPEGDLDHIDLNRTNNRIANLRLATRSQNMANTRRHRDNQTGFKGVVLHKKSGLYRAQIMISRRRKYLGYYKTPEAANAAYAAAASQCFGEYARDK